MIVPTSAAIWRRTALTRCSSDPPALPSTSGTRPKPMHSSSGSSVSASCDLIARRRRQRGQRRGGGDRSASAVSVAAAVLASARPAKMNRPPMTRNGIFGRPGISAKKQMTTPATIGARCWRADLADDLGAEVLGAAARVTMMPVATEISSAGICAARPSPTLSSEKCWIASPNGRSCMKTPMMMPPMRLIAVIRTRGHRVALDELRGAVHRAVEVGLLGDLRAALARLAPR